MRLQPEMEQDPLWYKDAILYELHVRAFQDSNADGMGDFRGLTDRLDYLQDLGVTMLWVLPFSPSPWRDDGYDIADYNDIHPAYGNLRDFQNFLKEAHRRGLKVLSEVVINHTSDQHPWFQKARHSRPGSKARDFYVWSDDPDRYKEARIIFKDFETSNWTWDPVAKQYFWHRFYSHQPDLNFDNPAVRKAVLDVVDFWFDMGVDAFRLDAIPYLYEREGTNCENLPETHAFLKEIRRHIDQHYPSRLVLAEANQWPEDSVAYFGSGDECNMAFHFPVMPRLFMSIRMEDRFPIIDILNQTPAIPENCQWAMFLRNHDELTLEMVTDEERDYMYRVYAEDRQARINLGIRRRLAPLLGNDRRKIELMNVLLFSLPGTPVLYYGDEIGMGDNVYLGDRNGVRTPMQWTADRNAGFSRANPQRLYLPLITDPEYHYENVNVEAQQNNANSLLWWTKRMIEQRKQYQAFGRGSLEFLHPANRKVLAFYRRYKEETLLVVVNLSRFPQHVSLDLRGAKGSTPVELFGRTEFPVVTDDPYLITLGGHGYYWFALEKRAERRESIRVHTDPSQIPVVSVASFDDLFQPTIISAVTRLLPDFLATRRWYRSKARTLRRTSVRDIVVFAPKLVIALVDLEYSEGEPETYLLSTAVTTAAEAEQLLREHPDIVLARLRNPAGEEAALHGALWLREFQDLLLGAIVRRKRYQGRNGEFSGWHTRELRKYWGEKHPQLEPFVSKADQSNSAIIYGDRFILKLFRKLEPGVNPDQEILQHLAEVGFTHTPPLIGTLEYRPSNGECMTAGILQSFVANQGDAWRLTLDNLSSFYEDVRARSNLTVMNASHPLTLAEAESNPEMRELAGTYLESARLMGQRTGELHLALAKDEGKRDFTPEPFTDHYRHGLFHGMNAQATRTLQLLTSNLSSLSDLAQGEAQAVLDQEEKIRNCMRPLRDTRFETTRIRHHGDLHLGQILYTGRDFVFIDFEGEPARPLSERRLKRSALRDVAGMLRSFQYSSEVALQNLPIRPDTAPQLEAWASAWTAWVGGAFLNGYLNATRGASFVPRDPQHLRILLDAYLLEKALYEIAYELNNRPDWVRIPLRGTLALLES